MDCLVPVGQSCRRFHMNSIKVLRWALWVLGLTTFRLALLNASAEASNIVVNSSFESRPSFSYRWLTNGVAGAFGSGQAYEGTNWVSVSGWTPVYAPVTNVTFSTVPTPWGDIVVATTSLTYVATSSNYVGLLSQDLATTAGAGYSVQFAVRGSGLHARVLWDGQSIGSFSNATFTNWTVTNFMAVATGTSARLSFENSTPNAGWLDLDEIRVSSLVEPASIIAQPQNQGGYAGGAAAFRVVVGGAPLIHLQWLRQGTILPNATNATLLITSLQTADAGTYQVVVTNAYGSVTSSVASLTVDPSPQEPRFIVQPDGRTLAAGYSVSLVAVAVGSPPLRYQWHKNGVPLANRTNAALVLANLSATDAGAYHSVATNGLGSATSSPATVVVTNGVGGGQFTLLNGFTPSMAAPAYVYDTDGITRLAGTNFIAQVHAGPTPTDLHPVGPLRPFQSGTLAGIFVPAFVTLADVSGGQTAYVQVRVWEFAAGETYEAARALGGRFGCSEIMTVQCGGFPPGGLPPLVPTDLYQPRSIHLQAGKPLFSTGRIGATTVVNGNTIQCALTGEPGSTYVIEKRTPSTGWVPIQVLQSVTGSVSFLDTNNVQTNVVMYRARLLN